MRKKLTLENVKEKETELKQQALATDKPLHPLQALEMYLRERYSFRMNKLSYEICAKNLTSGQAFVWDDITKARLLVEIMLHGFGFKVSEKMLETVIYGMLVEEYNPLADFFAGLKWDGKDHIARLSETVEISNPDLKKVWLPHLTKWLVSAYAQASGTGENHTVLVLSGAQGRGKTKWLNNLCPIKDMLFCGHIEPSVTNNNTANYLAEKLLVNIDDQLETMLSKDFNNIKSIITTPTVTNRKAYFRLAPTRQRVCSFTASVNSASFLTDSSNRRYLVFAIDDILLDKLEKVNIEQVWAQARHLLSNGFKYYFDKKDIAELDLLNEQFRNAPVEEELLSKYFYAPATLQDEEYMMQTEILDFLQEKIEYKLNSSRLTNALQALGFKKKDVRLNGKPRKVYVVARAINTDIDKLVKESLAASTAPNEQAPDDGDILPF